MIHLDPLYTAVSWVLLRWHQFFTFLGMNTDSGLTWGLSIVFLVVTARLLLFRLFIKQVHYQRKMQSVQPQMQKLREKYKNDRRTLQQEMMKLQQEEGFNPLAGCLPLVLQLPIFIGLFHTLRHLANSAHTSKNLTLYGFTTAETKSAAFAKLFSAPLSTSFHDPASKIMSLHGDVTSARIVTIFLVIVSSASTYITQRQVMKNAPTAAEGTAATMQKAMLYLIPFSVLFSGFVFPLGVLIYWFTSNLWTMGQQFYIYRFHPQAPVTATAGTATSTITNAAAKPAPGAKPVRPARKPQKTQTNQNGQKSQSKPPAPQRNGSAAKPPPDHRNVPSDSARQPAAAESDSSPAGSKAGAPRPGARPANRRPAQNRKKRR